MAPSRPVWLSATCVATLMGLAATCAQSAEGDAELIQPPYSYLDLRFGVVGAPAPDIRQTKPGGLAWSGADSRGTRFSITALHGSVKPEDYIAWTYGVSANVSSFDVGDPSVGSKDLLQATGDLYLGFQYGIVQTDSLRGFAEILPFAGGGMSRINLPDKKGVEKARLGAAYEAGVKSGVYLTERGWIAGITAGYLWGFSQVKSDAVTLNLRTNGFTFGGEFGYRF